MDHRLVALVLLVCVWVLVCRKVSKRVRIYLVSDVHGNEALVVPGSLSQKTMLFMIDTAYAGPPVLSTSYMGLAETMQSMPVPKRYRLVVDELKRNVTQDSRHRALSRFLSNNACRTYTSGCTMRLMGIGETSEAQSDMLLCNGIRLSGKTTLHQDSDVFVTNPLPSSVHIITIDYLLHRSPCVLMPGRGIFAWHVRDPYLKSSFEFQKPFFVGGAMRVAMTVGNTLLNIVIDTGAAAALSIALGSLAKIQSCTTTASPQKATQRGVNGEKVCSDVFMANVSLGRLNLGEVAVFANSRNVEGADGYAGMGLLRALDMWISPSEIGFRKSGLVTTKSTALSAGSCGGKTSLRCSK